ncbi:aldehyde dehydrogenase family protein [Streptomyces sp. NPDC047061]|uniref:aldehyde dehydrogenase family protein n=1 Tax=Streptomyces sp. NPDC047061 TaxID=3154605 RepID=UPI0033DF6127
MIGREEGAEVVVGSDSLTGEMYDSGYFIGPALFERVTPGVRIAQEEIFGPVLSVLAYEDEEKALAIANGTRCGLTAAEWTRDTGRAVRPARRIQAGRIVVNTPATADRAGPIGAPSGGYEHSGFGRSTGPDYLEDGTQVKAVVTDGGSRATREVSASPSGPKPRTRSARWPPGTTTMSNSSPW